MQSLGSDELPRHAHVYKLLNGEGAADMTSTGPAEFDSNLLSTQAQHQIVSPTPSTSSERSSKITWIERLGWHGRHPEERKTVGAILALLLSGRVPPSIITGQRLLTYKPCCVASLISCSLQSWMVISRMAISLQYVNRSLQRLHSY